VTPPGDRETPSDTPGDVELAPARVGLNELGRITVGARAVEKIAALAAVEIPDAGGAAARLLGRPVPGAGRLGIRGSGLNNLPKVTADIDGELGFLDVELSVRWPAPVSDVTEQVRQHLYARLGELVGLEVREVNIDVVDLITEAPSARVS
jgi:uncharacterized alkaline shock family protein YloU